MKYSPNKHKILLLISNINLVGGIERVVCQLANVFSEDDRYEVEIISIFTKYNDTFFEISNRVKLTHAGFNIDRNLNKFKRIKELNKIIYKILKDKKVDIIITFFGDISMSVLKNKKYLYDSKIIVTEHIDYFECSKKGRAIRNLIYRKADSVVVLTDEANRLYSRYLKKVETIPNMIPFVTENKSTLKQKRIVSIGRLDEVKRLDLLIYIFNEINKINKEWCLDIIGEGPCKNKLLEKIAEYSLEDKVKIKAFTPKIMDELLNSSIFAFTSKHEGFGMVLIEAQECGIPCISFDISSAKEIISNKKNGILVCDGDIDNYKKELLELMDNYEKRLILGSNAKNSVQKYRKNIIKEKWENLFKLLL